MEGQKIEVHGDLHVHQAPAALSKQAGREFRLPTEAEFEAAARGRGGRKYAYGEKFDAARSNMFESHIRRTTPVGIFGNATPEGVLGLSGNVYSWTSSAYKAYPYQVDDGREDLERAEEPRVVRGGSWNNNQNNARAAYVTTTTRRTATTISVSG